MWEWGGGGGSSRWCGSGGLDGIAGDGTGSAVVKGAAAEGAGKAAHLQASPQASSACMLQMQHLAAPMPLSPE